MRKIIQLASYFLLFLTINFSVYAQETKQNDPDNTLKEALYAKYKREVMAFDRNDFDKLFFEFFQIQGDSKILTKEEYYSYTIKIAIYSEKQGVLYKDKKEEAKKTKQEWFDKSYQDYLNSKK
jgi:D-lyxose ketol-isomerase